MYHVVWLIWKRWMEKRAALRTYEYFEGLGVRWRIPLNDLELQVSPRPLSDSGLPGLSKPHPPPPLIWQQSFQSLVKSAGATQSLHPTSSPQSTVPMFSHVAEPRLAPHLAMAAV